MRGEPKRTDRRSVPSPEEFLASFSPQVQAVAAILRALIHDAVPEPVEAVYPGWRLIGYKVRDGSRGRYFGFIAPEEDHVRLGFEYGVLLQDPGGLLEGAGKQVRYVSLGAPEDVRPELLKPLIAEAAALALSRWRA